MDTSLSPGRWVNYFALGLGLSHFMNLLHGVGKHLQVIDRRGNAGCNFLVAICYGAPRGSYSMLRKLFWGIYPKRAWFIMTEYPNAKPR